jgi:hypothetical protein
VNESLVPELDVLKTPQAPAFTALGVTPATIERPSTPTGAAIDVVTGLARGVLTPGNNLALQATPFWLTAHPDLSARDVQSSPWATWYRDLTISLATAQATVQRADSAGIVTGLPLNRIALGFRTTIYPGDPSTEALACERVLDQYTLEGAVAFNKEAGDFEKEFEKTYPMPPEPKVEDPGEVNETRYPDPAKRAAAEAAKSEWDAYLAAADAWSSTRDEALKLHSHQLKQAGYAKVHPMSDEVKACLPVVRHRTGPMLDVAAVVTGETPTGATSLEKPGSAVGWTAWTTLAWVFSRGRLSDPKHRTPFDLSVLALGRYQADYVRGPYVDQKALDYGLRFVLALERWGFSVEGLGRYDKALPKFDFMSCSCGLKAGGMVDYRLHSGMWATLSFGTDFRELDGTTPLRLLANFQANFGLERLITPDTTTTAPAGDNEEATP